MVRFYYLLRTLFHSLCVRLCPFVHTVLSSPFASCIFWSICVCDVCMLPDLSICPLIAHKYKNEKNNLIELL